MSAATCGDRCWTTASRSNGGRAAPDGSQSELVAVLKAEGLR